MADEAADFLDIVGRGDDAFHGSDHGRGLAAQAAKFEASVVSPMGTGIKNGVEAFLIAKREMQIPEAGPSDGADLDLVLEDGVGGTVAGERGPAGLGTAKAREQGTGVGILRVSIRSVHPPGNKYAHGHGTIFCAGKARRRVDSREAR